MALIFLPLVPFVGRLRGSDRLALGINPLAPGKKSIWIHALSVGEVISALPVLRSIKDKYPSSPVVFTVRTAQGMAVARRDLEGKVEALLPMPLDFWWSVRRFVRRIRPSVLILVETDLWPGMLAYLERRGVKTILINGRISPRTFRTYRRFKALSRALFDTVEVCLMQSDLDRARLLEIGLSPEKVKLIGNIKFDRTWLPMENEEHACWARILKVKPEDRIWVSGSIHPGEELIVLKVFERLLPRFPELRLIIAPRRLERAGDILRLCLQENLEALRRTDLPHAGDRAYRVLILDTMGELGRVYGLAEISFVGGSMAPIGGHNLLEPAAFGCPVLFGPHTHNFVHMSRALIEAGGGRRVRDLDDLYEAMKTLLTDAGMLRGMGRRAKAFVETNKGATGRVMAYLGRYIETA